MPTPFITVGPENFLRSRVCPNGLKQVRMVDGHQLRLKKRETSFSFGAFVYF
jgi:hypothetical protein